MNLKQSLRSHTSYLQKNADSLYNLVPKGNIFKQETEQDKAAAMAMWHAHEIVKSINAILYVAERFDSTKESDI